MSRVVVAWYPRSAKASTAATSSRRAASGVTSAHGCVSPPGVSCAVLIAVRPFSTARVNTIPPNLSERLVPAPRPGPGRSELLEGVVHPAARALAVLAVPDDLGEGEGGRHEVEDGDGQEGPHPGVGLELEDAEGGGGHGDGEGRHGLPVEGGGVLLFDR